MGVFARLKGVYLFLTLVLVLGYLIARPHIGTMYTIKGDLIRGVMKRDSLCCVYNRRGFDIGDSPQAGERASPAARQ